MKKFVPAIIALAVCSLSFAADSATVNAPKQAAAASAQNLAAQAALRGPFCDADLLVYFHLRCERHLLGSIV